MALTPEQLAQRKNYIGGSDAAVVVGISPYKTPLQLWLEKRGETIDQEETEAMEWGNRLEEAIANAYAEKTGHQIRRQPTKISKEHPFMAVNVDRQIISVDKRGPGYLEVKNFGHFTSGFDKEAQTVADYVQIQVQHGLAVTGWGWGDYAVLVGGQRFYYGTVERDKEVIDFLIEAEAQFWDMVKKGIQPEADGRPRTVEFLRHLYPQDNGKPLVLDHPRLTELANQLVETQAAKKALEEREEQLKNGFKMLCGEHQILRIPDFGELSWKNQQASKKTFFDESAFQAVHPDLYKEFTKTITTKGHRVFTVHPGRDSSVKKLTKKQKEIANAE